MITRTVLVALVALVAAGCGQDATTRADRGAAGPVHVHALQIDPEDGAILLATHAGLFRLEPDARRIERVGPRRHLVALQVTGPGSVIASGHAGARTDQRSSIGLIASQDSGRNWSPVGLPGAADLHVLRSGRTRVYGYDGASLRLLVTADAGRTWQRRSVPGVPVDLAVAPDDEQHVLVATEDGLHRSRDAGRTWRAAGRSPTRMLVAWVSAGMLFGVTADSSVARSRDSGRTWRVAGRPGGRIVALAADDGQVVVARRDGTVLRSRDRGRSWNVRARAAW